DGFASAAGELIAELQQALVSPQRLSQALGAWAAQDQRRAGYARDVAGLDRSHLDQLRRAGRGGDGLDRGRGARGPPPGAPRADARAWGADAVFFYGFDDLHPLERDAIETLARIVDADVTVSLTYEPGRTALGARAEAVEELRPLAGKVVELPPLSDHYEPAA